jgi:S-DNA-T family DNA segregation ATPase FtsK/SpoIIIE
VVFGAVWCWAVPAGLAAYAAAVLVRRAARLRPWLLRIGLLWLVSTAWVAQPGGPLGSVGAAARWGGAVGFWLARGAHAGVGLWGGRIFLTLAFLVALLALLQPWLGRSTRRFARFAARWTAAARSVGGAVFDVAMAAVAGLRTLADRLRLAGRRSAPEPARPAGPSPATVAARSVHPRFDASPEADSEFATPRGAAARASTGSPGPAATAVPPKAMRQRRDTVALPPLDLLAEPDAAAAAFRTADLDAAADLLEATLQSFGVSGEIKDVRPGPVVTTFEYQPGSGIRVSQIVQRADDLALALRARSLRLEAPIPGKAAVGIEIPNPQPQTVRLKEILRASAAAPRTPLTVALGKDVVGQPVAIDLAELPHLLVAGSTGSGKSVCLNSLICNLLLFNGPERLRLLLIDPKMLELNVYNGIPHLLLPVVTDPREALRALRWLVAQMDRRYQRLARWSVRSIDQYNAKLARGEILDAEGEPLSEPMPYYVCIVDELADLMIQLGQEIELPITRLAQKARAVGIHLVLATQRPSVDVLTGVIKANIPCRIAFRVIQKNDSRTILDLNGAEQLLGRGDMLYLKPGRAQPQRVHGAFLDVAEAEAVAAFWREFDELTETVDLGPEGTGDTGVRGEDDLFEEARRVVVLHQSGSTSLLQRRLRVGYTRAGRLMDMLEEAGVVGPFTGSKAREVLIKPENLADLSGDEAEA